MSKTFHLTIARVGEQIFDGEAISVLLPGTEGLLEVLAHHEPFVSRLKAGEVRYVDAAGTKHHLDIVHGGVAEVSHNQATILL